MHIRNVVMSYLWFKTVQVKIISLNRLYIELYDRLLGLEYSRYRKGNPTESVALIIAEINEITRIKYTRAKNPTSASWLHGFLKASGTRPQTNDPTPSLKDLCLHTTPDNWTHPKAVRTQNMFNGNVPRAPSRRRSWRSSYKTHPNATTLTASSHNCDKHSRRPLLHTCSHDITKFAWYYQVCTRHSRRVMCKTYLAWHTQEHLLTCRHQS